MSRFHDRGHWPPLAAGDEGDTPMNRKLWIGLTACGLFWLLLTRSGGMSTAEAQKARDESQWEYKVFVASYNPGERMTDEQRAASYERTLNEQARKGWEPVCTLLSRDSVQTVGGAVTTRDTTAFLAYRRLKR
jgi:hypothetical protein